MFQQNASALKTNLITGIVSLPLFAILASFSPAQAQNPSSEQLTPAEQSLSEVGLEFEGFRSLNTATVVSTEYTGECPGSYAGSLKASFLSSKTPPAQGLRVVIRNITRGIGGKTMPYTDREYDEGRLSEDFVVSPATRHNGKFLAVLAGVNDFEYEIRRDRTVLESGQFTATIDRQTRTLDRSAKIL